MDLTLTKAQTIAEAINVSTDAEKIIPRHGSWPVAYKACGKADPMVKAPTRAPRANPRPLRYQLAMIFMPVG